MKIAVRYFTRSGNTKTLADAVASALGVAAEDVSAGLGEETDLVFLGSSLYANGFDPAIAAFLTENAPRIGTLVCFGSSATNRSTFSKVRALAEQNGIRVCEREYHCPGRFLMLHRGRPNQNDCEKAAAFAREVCAMFGA